ncbi:DNA-directed RNA polymerase II subunit RPB9 [Emericellopsis cladophorae]|uniref:DNA-directed RNA polymerase II subunit RPB9 n=1 Tax=Emericellopsis cladophorae TaxID=2686198 RepID=A0A9Q0BHY9_9HYPO|nr:DNA-directed RNA polymerase II subunit RPB9 [Emericellopsis cladophorae]KAI6785270.1 DNA-directed RNA polymerase II subunit RPB9 [Emericellopsis cladophorae]
MSHDGAEKNQQVTFRFCSECSNMLYPKEDEDSHKLQFTCRTCFYTEDAQTTCVFRNVLNQSAGETAGVTHDVASDPTLYRNNEPSDKRTLTDTGNTQRDRVLQCESLDELMTAVGSGFDEKDPFDEYDEEPLYEPYGAIMSDSDDHSICTDGSDVSNDGAMVLDW